MYALCSMADPGKSIDADLNGVTYADPAATELLATMNRQGVRLIGRGVMMRALIDQRPQTLAARTEVQHEHLSHRRVAARRGLSGSGQSSRQRLLCIKRWRIRSTTIGS